MSLSRKLAEEIINVLKFNPQLSQDDKILAVELRLTNLMTEVEKACAEAHKRKEAEAIIVDERPQDIPPLAEAMLARQERLLN